MTLHKSILYTFGLALILIVSYLFGVHTMIAKAAQIAFTPATCYTAAATSTLSYMTPGTATTTATCPMGQDGADSAVLAIQVNASSTAAVFDVYVEESMDGIDWYPIQQEQVASTSNPFSLQIRQYAQFTFASSTVGGALANTNGVGVNGTQNRNHYELDVPVRMKRVRAYTGITGANAGVWMQILPKVGI